MVKRNGLVKMLIKLVPREADTASGPLRYLNWAFHLLIDSYVSVM